MPAPDDSVYRALTCGEWRKLRPCSHLAMRVFFELFYGDDSERAGVNVCRESERSSQPQRPGRDAEMLVHIRALLEAGGGRGSLIDGPKVYAITSEYLDRESDL